jgi:hypothetical protein
MLKFCGSKIHDIRKVRPISSESSPDASIAHLCLPGASEGARCLLNKVKAEINERTEKWKTAQHMFTLQADHDAAAALLGAGSLLAVRGDTGILTGAMGRGAGLCFSTR